MTTHFKDFSTVHNELASSRKFHAAKSQNNFYRDHAKRLFDIVFVIAAAPIALPLVALFMLLAALDGNKPLYWQERVGKGGRVFRMLKIRTMVPDADEKLEAYLDANSEARAEWDETQKLKHDPRITPIGALLRKSSMDELPQFWNVLIGDMSIIGPRPMMTEQKELYPGHAYFRLRPGVSGPWQVSDRNESSFAERAKFDADYYKDVSLGHDLNILARTIGVVLRCTGH